jgi:type IV pilus assembly protein PilA
MRYAGSKFMELEAGDDWMARLWKTYQETRLVFIDVRDVTPYVHQEIEMTLKTMGIQRCIFVVGPGKTRDEWRATISMIAGPEAGPSQFNLLDASSPQLESDLKAMVKAIPEGFPGATAQGRQYVLDHVSAEEIRKGQRTSLAQKAVIALALLFSLVLNPLIAIMVAVYALVIPMSAAGDPALATRIGMIPVFAIMILPIFRTFSRIFRLVDAGSWAQAMRAALSLIGAITLLGASVAIVAAFLPAYMQGLQGIFAGTSPQSRGHDTVSAINSLRAIQQAETRYRAAYPDRGYACSLEALGGDPKSGPPTPSAAQLIPADLASGSSLGYEFEIACNGAMTTNGVHRYDSFIAYATPAEVGKTGDRGYCTDESGVIAFDPAGGVACTEPLK